MIRVSTHKDKIGTCDKIPPNGFPHLRPSPDVQFDRIKDGSVLQKCNGGRLRQGCGACWVLRFPNSHATILSVQIFQTAILSVPEVVFKLQFCHWQLFQTAISVQISYEQILTKMFYVQIFWTTILYVRILFVLHTEEQDGCVITFLLQWHLMHFTPSCLTVMRGKIYILGWFNHNILLTSYSALFD